MSTHNNNFIYSHQLLRAVLEAVVVRRQAEALVGKRVKISFILCFFQSLFTHSQFR
jgi:hypothetical protein